MPRISRATYTYVQNRRRARIRARAQRGPPLVIVTVIVAVPFARSVPAIADSARACPSLARSRATHVSFFFLSCISRLFPNSLNEYVIITTCLPNTISRSNLRAFSRESLIRVPRGVPFHFSSVSHPPLFLSSYFSYARAFTTFLSPRECDRSLLLRFFLDTRLAVTLSFIRVPCASFAAASDKIHTDTSINSCPSRFRYP